MAEQVVDMETVEPGETSDVDTMANSGGGGGGGNGGGGGEGAAPDVGEGSIQVYLRVKPIKAKTKYVSTDVDNSRLEFNIPVQKNLGTDNDRLRNAKFQFHGILDQGSKQPEVYELVAKDCVASVMAGFNSTIFAYGQTGSGKTYTMTGGPHAYAERGIIPRVLNDLFARIEQQSDAKFLVCVRGMNIRGSTYMHHLKTCSGTAEV